MKFKTLFITCLLSMLTACQSIEKRISAEVAINELNLQKTPWQSQVEQLQFANDNWLQNLNDPRLEKYVHIALKNNFTLQSNEASLAAQVQNAKQVSSQLFPRIDFLLRRNSIESEAVNAANNSPANNTTPISDTSSAVNSVSYDGNFNISWEIDIWRRLSAQTKASAKTTLATVADFEAARFSLVATVARAWFNLNSLKLQVDIAQKRLTTIKESLEIVEEQYLNGSQSALNVYLTRTDFIAQKANILELKESLNTAIRGFRVLLGEYPNLDTTFEANLPDIEKTIPAGLPADLIMRRPDVLADLYEWQSTAYDTKAAKRARYPTFSLTASYGASSNSLSSLDEASLLLNLLNNLSLPLFRGGQIQAQIKASSFLEEASFKTYLATLLTSFNEVETTLSAEQSLKQRLQLLIQAESLSEAGYQLALDQYTAGISLFETVLEARQRWFDAQITVIDLRNAVLQNRIDLNLALGGDFNSKNKPKDSEVVDKQHSLNKQDRIKKQDTELSPEDDTVKIKAPTKNQDITVAEKNVHSDSSKSISTSKKLLPPANK